MSPASLSEWHCFREWWFLSTLKTSSCKTFSSKLRSWEGEMSCPVVCKDLSCVVFFYCTFTLDLLHFTIVIIYVSTMLYIDFTTLLHFSIPYVTLFLLQLFFFHCTPNIFQDWIVFHFWETIWISFLKTNSVDFQFGSRRRKKKVMMNYAAINRSWGIDTLTPSQGFVWSFYFFF